MKKEISTEVQSIIDENSLFEINDVITREKVAAAVVDRLSRERSMNFIVVCDETNNTPEVIYNNTLKIDVYVKSGGNFMVYNFEVSRGSIDMSQVEGSLPIAY
jgi:hypothetical protein